MRIVEIYTRANVRDAKGWVARRSEAMLDGHPGHDRVVVLERGVGRVIRCKPASGEIAYIKATSGKWAKSMETRVGPPRVHTAEEVVAIECALVGIAKAWAA